MDIFLAPLKVSNKSLVDRILAELSKLFYSNIHQIDLPVDVESAFSKDRGQYFSTNILSNTIDYTGHIKGKIVLFVEFDLFVPVLTYVFGEAQLNGKHSIVSVCRLHEEFYSGRSNDHLLFERTMKEVLHELGHNYGLRHCIDWDCVMHSSMGIEEVDVKGKSYCKNCAEQIPDYKNIPI